MKQRKPKSYEPSLRDKLSANFLRDFEADFAANGAAVIQQLREKHPEKYAEIASRLIAQTEPPHPNDLSQAKSLHDIGRLLLEGVGCANPSDEKIALACEANSVLMDTLESIAAGQLDVSTEMAEERELRQ